MTLGEHCQGLQRDGCSAMAAARFCRSSATLQKCLSCGPEISSPPGDLDNGLYLDRRRKYHNNRRGARQLVCDTFGSHVTRNETVTSGRPRSRAVQLDRKEVFPRSRARACCWWGELLRQTKPYTACLDQPPAFTGPGPDSVRR